MDNGKERVCRRRPRPSIEERRFSVKRTIILVLTLVLCLGLAVPASASEFSDISEQYIFHDAIQDCARKGILSGYSDGTFRPGVSVTRAQFCVMLVRAFYTGEDEAFDRWKSVNWYAPSAAALAACGVMPYGEKSWAQPSVMNQSITRRDMSKFIANVMKDKGYTVSEEAKNAAAAKIKDYASVGEYYEDAVKTVFALGIITGQADGSFGGSRSTSRGQAAMVIYRMTRYMSQAPGVLASLPEEPQEVPTTLTNGKAPTEENVAEMIKELRTLYLEGTNFSAGYPYGDASPVRNATYLYSRAEDPNTHTSNVIGCGAWATLVSDTIYGQAGFALRKTTLADARPGDVVIYLDKNGLLLHVAAIVERPKTENGQTVFTITEAVTDAQDVYRIGWDVRQVWPNSKSISFDVYTRYPE